MAPPLPHDGVKLESPSPSPSPKPSRTRPYITPSPTAFSVDRKEPSSSYKPKMSGVTGNSPFPPPRLLKQWVLMMNPPLSLQHPTLLSGGTMLALSIRRPNCPDPLYFIPSTVLPQVLVSDRNGFRLSASHLTRVINSTPGESLCPKKAADPHGRFKRPDNAPVNL